MYILYIFYHKWYIKVIRRWYDDVEIFTDIDIVVVYYYEKAPKSVRASGNLFLL